MMQDKLHSNMRWQVEELAASLAGVTTSEIEEYGSPRSLLERLFGELPRPFSWRFSGDELLFLRILEGWQGLPRY